MRATLVAALAASLQLSERGHPRIRPRRAGLAEFDEFDVVEYSRNGTAVELGVISDGRLQPLCCWQESDPVELVWDEDQETLEDANVLNAVDAWPQQRLIDGGIGPNNPHGEESEDVYVVDRAELRADTIVLLREDREVWW